MQKTSQKAKRKPAPLPLNSQSRKLIREIERAQRSRDHTALVKQLNRKNAAMVKQGYEPIDAHVPVPQPQHIPAIEVSVLDELDDMLSQDNELCDSLDKSEDADPDEIDDDVEPVQIEVEVEVEAEAEAEPATQESANASAKPKRRKPIVVVQRPRIAQHAARQLCASSSSWLLCAHCNKLMSRDRAFTSEILDPLLHFHLQCIQRAVLENPDQN